ncbi:MAG: tRNA 2-thiouridine(34) synthase MnmA [Deferribacterales bacterium]
MKRVVVAMSGGVDSSTTAYLLKQDGYEVIGITFKMFDGQDKYLIDAEKVAKQIGIKWELVDKTVEFNETVISYFINSYRKGKTPNPCALCNREAKFYYLFTELLRYDADFIATGHYANKILENGKLYIKRSFDSPKDQSYYLSLVKREVLEKTIFPLANMEKNEVRKIATSFGLVVADKKDSQEICFLEGADYRDYLRKKIDPNKIRKGDFILNNKVIGKHYGIEFYTVGQRRGLNLSYHNPLYVYKIEPETGNIILVENKDKGFRGVKLENCNFYNEEPKLFRGSAKLRYKMKDAECLVELLPDNRAHLLFDTPQSFPAPGQVAAIYQREKLLGGGFIEGVF